MPIEGIRPLSARRFVSSEKAVRELGASFRPLEETLRDEVAWFRAAALAPPAPEDAARAHLTRASTR